MIDDNYQEPPINELIETCKKRKAELMACCGLTALILCLRCRTSKTIAIAYDNYQKEIDRSRTQDWPETVEEKEPCEKCGSFEKVGKWMFADTEDYWSICEKCNADEQGFTDWLAGEFEKVLAEDDEYIKMPNGKYRFIGDSK